MPGRAKNYLSKINEAESRRFPEITNSKTLVSGLKN
jgi:hypothetical protein